ncbi:hypothetical protein [Nocardia sp. NPDC049149]|uniref:hypothetical protein n=1 Tax=Nocardia sp. NPDC049149 TaxID=3364315 RepID=UPI003717D3D4
MVRRAREWVLDIVRALLASLIALGCAGLAVAFVSLYELVAPDSRYLAIAQVVGWGGVAVALIWTIALMIRKLRYRMPIAWTPMTAVPLIIGSWLLGFLIALVLAEI